MTTLVSVIDQPARDLARDALEKANAADHKIEAHEDLCAVRYASLQKTMAEQGQLVEELYRRLWKVAGVVIVLLLGVIGSLLALLWALR